MRVLTVLNWLNLGGIELQTLHAIPWLKRQGIEMDCCCTGPPGVLDREFAGQGCGIWRIPKTANCYAAAHSLRRLLAGVPCDIVHSHFGHTSGGFVLGAAGMRIPAIVSFHSSQPLSLYRWRGIPILGRLRSGWLAWHRRLIEENASVLVGHSQANLGAFEPRWTRDCKRYRVIHNGIDFPARRWTRQAARAALAIGQEPVVLHVGTFREEKNHRGLLEVLCHVRKRLPGTQLLLVGDGPLRRHVQEDVGRMHLAQNVRFEGLQRDVWCYYAAADAFLFPSVTEGFGNVLVESQAAGLPLVASDLDAHHESVAPIQQRFLFKLPWYAVAADMVLQQIEAARSGRNPWVAESQSYVRDRFSTERYARHLAQLYQELAA